MEDLRWPRHNFQLSFGPQSQSHSHSDIEPVGLDWTRFGQNRSTYDTIPNPHSSDDAYLVLTLTFWGGYTASWCSRSTDDSPSLHPSSPRGNPMTHILLFVVRKARDKLSGVVSSGWLSVMAAFSSGQVIESEAMGRNSGTVLFLAPGHVPDRPFWCAIKLFGRLQVRTNSALSYAPLRPWDSMRTLPASA